MHRACYVNRNRATSRGDGTRLFRQNLCDDRLRRAARMRRIASQHLVCDARQRVDVESLAGIKANSCTATSFQTEGSLFWAAFLG